MENKATAAQALILDIFDAFAASYDLHGQIGALEGMRDRLIALGVAPRKAANVARALLVMLADERGGHVPTDYRAGVAMELTR